MKNGTCINLSPMRWLDDPLEKYKKHTNYKKYYNDVVKYIDEVKKVHFKSFSKNFLDAGVSLDVAVYSFKKKLNFDPDKIKTEKCKYGEQIYQKVFKKSSSFVKDKLEQYVNRSTNIFTFIVKIGGHYGRGEPYTSVFYKPYPYFVNNKYNNMTPEEIKKSNHYSARGSINNWNVICFDKADEVKNFYYSHQTKFYRSLILLLIIDQNVPIKYLPYLNDYSHIWTDDEFYNFYEITNDERNYMEKLWEKYNK